MVVGLPDDRSELLLEYAAECADTQAFLESPKGKPSKYQSMPRISKYLSSE